MKLIGFSILILCSCRMQYEIRDFNNCLYKTESYHLVGSNSLYFYTDSFFLREREGMFYSKGTFKMSPNKGEIILESINPPISKGLSKLDSTFIDVTGERIVIKNRKKIIFKNMLYKRVNKPVLQVNSEYKSKE
jgi:hypothetical protein